MVFFSSQRCILSEIRDTTYPLTMQSFGDTLSFFGLYWEFRVCPRGQFSSLYLNDAIWRHGSGSTLTLIEACCLRAPNHYLNQCWLTICEFLRHSLRAIVWRVPKLLVSIMSLDIILLKILSHLTTVPMKRRGMIMIVLTDTITQ